LFCFLLGVPFSDLQTFFYTRIKQNGRRNNLSR
jgi:hypothetical protein